MAVNVPLQVAEEICHILNEFEIKSLQPCPICDQSVTINEYISDYLYSINCECCGLKTRRFRSKQNLIKYWNATKSEQAMCYLQKDEDVTIRQNALQCIYELTNKILDMQVKDKYLNPIVVDINQK